MSNDHEDQFSYDEGLLHEGRYREWFWAGLTPAQVAYLHLPPRMPQVKTNSQPTVLNGWFSEQPIWHDDAACKDADPMVFFKQRHEEDDYLDASAEWRKFCPQCPVREACLQAARDSESVGIWGGVLRYKEKTRDIKELDDRISGAGAH